MSGWGKYYNEFVVDAVIKHWPGKTITESDNNLFCLLTMNHHPLHLMNTYADKTNYGKILVVGTYVISLVVGMCVKDITGKVTASLEFNIKHDAPVFIGDTIIAETEIIDKKICSNKKQGIVTIETVAYNQDNIKVLTMRRKLLVPIDERK